MRKLLLSFALLTILGARMAWAQDNLFQGPHGPNGTWNLYELGEFEATWAEAVDFAREMERMGVTGELASIHSIEENSTVHFVGGGESVWIGLTDREGAAPLLMQNGAMSPQESIELEGKGCCAAANAKLQGWAWTSGEPFNFSLWNGGEPGNGGGSEDVAHIWPGGDWNDAASGYFEDEPEEAILQPGTSTDEAGGTPLPYVIEYRTEAAMPFPDIQVFTPEAPPELPTDAISEGIDTLLAESETGQLGPDRPHGDLRDWEWDGEDGGGQNHGLLWFDIPQESLLRFGDGTATLTLQISNEGSSADVYRVAVDWLSGPDGGNNVTWDNIPDGPGLFPGGNVADDPSFATDPVAVGEIEFDVTDDVLAWASGEPNYGWGFIPTGGNGAGIRSFESGRGPLLLLELELPPLPAGDSLQAGDADQDLDFDQLDLVQVQIGGKYLTGNPATWGEGDWNGAPGGSQGSPPSGNGLFDQIDIIAALNAGVYLTGPYAAVNTGGVEGDGQTSIGYDPGTGHVWVDAPAGVELTSINIDSVGGIFTGEAAQNLGGSFDNDADNNIFKATFGGSFGQTSFGNVAQAGLSQDFLLNDLTVVGSLAGGGDLGAVDLIYVPEPTTIGLFVVGILFGFQRVRRMDK